MIVQLLRVSNLSVEPATVNSMEKTSTTFMSKHTILRVKRLNYHQKTMILLPNVRMRCIKSMINNLKQILQMLKALLALFVNLMAIIRTY